ncbi:MAG: VOC family protein [Chitinophagaceae bacterium]|nr:VOC family protein [Chitinophagaceae bacterium]
MADSSTMFGCDSVNPGFVVADVEAAANFYRDKLGFSLDWLWGDPPTYGSMTLGNISVHLLKGNERVGKGYAVFSVEDVDGLYKFHQDNEVQIVEPISNKEYNMRDYYVQDLYGNILGFGHYILPTTPELKIERVDVPIRLEKRLAAVLNDLAAIKGMSISSTLEETLLHTFEPLGDGVASPHTKSDLRKIQGLKKKHGIDYDTHASYRFVE